MDDHYHKILNDVNGGSAPTKFPDLVLEILSPDEVELIPSAKTAISNGPIYHPIAHGGYADVYRALVKRKGSGNVVEAVVKVIRSAHLQADDEKKMATYINRLRREYGVWGSLAHPNIVRLEGVLIHAAFPSAGLVSHFKPYMDLAKFIQKGHTFDRLYMVQKIACGLAYLHEKKVVHGDLTLANVLVDKDQNGTFFPLITDFGKSRLVDKEGYTTAMGDTPLLSRPPEFLQCTSPELITNKLILVPASDVYSMSLVFLELLTGKKAYCEGSFAQYQVIIGILSGVRPTPEKYPMLDPSYDYVWPIMMECWKTEAADRITSEEAHRRLCEASHSLVRN